MSETKAPITAALKAKLLEEEARLETQLAPHRDLHDRHVNDPKFLAAKRAIKEISPKLAAVKNELAALARAGGAKSLKAEPGEYKAG